MNAPNLIGCNVLKHVVYLVPEAKTGGLFHNGQTAIALKQALETMDHKQKPILVKTDNKIANSFVHAAMRIKRSKIWDMQYHW